MHNGVGNAQFVPRSIFAAYLGRNQAPELFTVQPFVINSQTLIPKTLSINRPLEAILLRWSGRVVVAVANYAAVASEAPQTIINRIRIFGTYKGTALTPIDMSGATAFSWNRLFGFRGTSLIINGARQADATLPFQQVGATFGNIGTYDVDIWYLIPMWPVVDVAARALNVSPYCWQPRDWNDTLQIQLNFGDLTSFGTAGGGGTTTFTAFGSGAGSPSVRIYTRYLNMGPLRAGFRSACVVRNEQTVVAGLTAIANNVRLMVLAKQKTSNIVIKTGRTLTGTSSTVNVFADLRDTLLESTQMLVDNRPIRNNQDNFTFKEHSGLQFNTVLPEGYLTIPFVDSQSPRTAFRGDRAEVVAPGATFELVTNVAETNADSVANLVQEQIYADADDPYWLATR